MGGRRVTLRSHSTETTGTKKSFKTFKISKLNSVKVGYKKKENTSINYSDNQKTTLKEKGDF